MIFFVNFFVFDKFLDCNVKTHYCIFSKLCRYVHHVMEVCCIVFDIDGMLFEFVMIFLAKISLYIIFLIHVLRFMLFPTFLERKQIPGGGGGVGWWSKKFQGRGGG